MGWVGLGQLFGGLGWAGSMKIDPRTTLVRIGVSTKSRLRFAVGTRLYSEWD